MTTPLDLLSALLLDNGRRWGEVATELQWPDAVAIFADDGPRRRWWSLTS